MKDIPLHSHRAAYKSNTYVTLFLRKLWTHLPLHSFTSQKTILLRCFGAKYLNCEGNARFLTDSNVLITRPPHSILKTNKQKMRNSNNTEKQLVTSPMWLTYFPPIGYITVTSLIHVSRNKCNQLKMYIYHKSIKNKFNVLVIMVCTRWIMLWKTYFKCLILHLVYCTLNVTRNSSCEREQCEYKVFIQNPHKNKSCGLKSADLGCHNHFEISCPWNKNKSNKITILYGVSMGCVSFWTPCIRNLHQPHCIRSVRL